MLKALDLSLFKSSSLAGIREKLIWDITCPSCSCSRAAACTSELLTALPRNPLIFCQSLKSKSLSALTTSLPGIAGSQRLRENNTGVFKVIASLLNRH